MYEIHVQRGRKISRAAGQSSYIDIIVIALLETSVADDGERVCIYIYVRAREGDALFSG